MFYLLVRSHDIHQRGWVISKQRRVAWFMHCGLYFWPGGLCTTPPWISGRKPSLDCRLHRPAYPAKFPDGAAFASSLAASTRFCRRSRHDQIFANLQADCQQLQLSTSGDKCSSAHEDHLANGHLKWLSFFEGQIKGSEVFEHTLCIS